MNWPLAHIKAHFTPLANENKQVAGMLLRARELRETIRQNSEELEALMARINRIAGVIPQGSPDASGADSH